MTSGRTGTCATACATARSRLQPNACMPVSATSRTARIGSVEIAPGMPCSPVNSPESGHRVPGSAFAHVIACPIACLGTHGNGPECAFGLFREVSRMRQLRVMDGA